MPVHEVVIPIFDGIQPSDVTGPYDVLMLATMGLAHLDGGRAGYSVSLVTVNPGPVTAGGGLKLLADGPLPETGDIGTLLVPGGPLAPLQAVDENFVAWLRRAALRSGRVVSVCTGTFLLAAAGLLDGLAATTHWRSAPALAQDYPAVEVHSDAIYLRQGRIWTSAGVTAGIDLALALVESDHGVDLAQRIAREMLVFLRRPGGQSQFAGPVWTPPAHRASVRAAQDLIHAQPAADLRVQVLAAKVGMSERHLSREFARVLGCAPAAYVEQVRVDTARRILQSEPDLLTVVAVRSGFGSVETMRRAFVRRLGVPPDQYRRGFSALLETEG
ncbi:MAG: DJ-1/PfpI family protein [Actinomycetota bacterium]|nr:DJ-1/PfpI family protein [Actinomycetota bacterium]